MDYRLNSNGVKSVEEKYHYTVGYVDGCYSSWSITLPSGIVNINGRLFLSIPNAWDDRLVYYPWYCGHIYWDSNQYVNPGDNASSDNTHPPVTANGAQWNDVYYRYYHGNENNLIPEVKKNQFPYKLLVDYGEYKNAVSVTPAHIFSTQTPNLLLKLNIHVYNSGSLVKFLISVISSDISVQIDFGDGQYSKLSVGNITTHTYSSSGDYEVKLYLVNGFLDIDSPYLIRSTLDSSSPIINDVRDYPIVYEVSSSSGDSIQTLTGFFINSVHAKACADIDTFVSHKHLSYVQYIKSYLDEDITEYKYLRLKNTHVDNLYLYSNTDNYFKLVFEDSSDVDNIYVSSEITVLDLSAGDTTSILSNNGSDIYLYSSEAVTILSKSIYNGFSYNVDGKSVSFGSSVVFHVRSSILSSMQARYPLLNFSVI